MLRIVRRRPITGASTFTIQEPLLRQYERYQSTKGHASSLRRDLAETLLYTVAKGDDCVSAAEYHAALPASVLLHARMPPHPSQRNQSLNPPIRRSLRKRQHRKYVPTVCLVICGPSTALGSQLPPTTSACLMHRYSAAARSASSSVAPCNVWNVLVLMFTHA